MEMNTVVIELAVTSALSKENVADALAIALDKVFADWEFDIVDEGSREWVMGRSRI